MNPAFLKENNTDPLLHPLESFLSQIQLLLFASLVVCCILIK